jgi:hypothetical protein
MRYQVVEGTQVHLDGTTYAGGELLPELDADTAARWLAAGWITPAAKATKPRKTAR